MNPRICHFNFRQRHYFHVQMQSVQKMKGFQQNTSSSCREQKRLTYCYIVLGSTHEYHLNYILRSIVPFFEVVY